MANPIIVNLPSDTWVKVATGVTSGTIHIKDRSPNLYLQTYRITTDPAPINDSDAVEFGPDVGAISSTSEIDVYLKAVGADGSVRVDL